jgi:chromosome segregation ATPase
MPKQKSANDVLDRVEQLLGDRQKQLDERGQLLSFREAQVNELTKERASLDKRVSDLHAQKDVLDKQVNARQKVLNQITKDISSKEKEMQSKSDHNKNAIEALEAELEKLKKMQDGNEMLLSSQSTQIKVNKEGLNVLKEQIKERQDYLSGQERIVNQTIQQWNDQFFMLKSDLESLEAEKRRVMESRTQIEQETQSAKEESELVSAKLEQLTELYDRKIGEYKTTITTLDKEINDKQSNLTELVADNELQKKALSVKERSISLRERALEQKENELKDREKRLRLNFDLASIPYDN